jgi:hypothetical protein
MIAVVNVVAMERAAFHFALIPTAKTVLQLMNIVTGM